jgi:hypothetical protein
MRPIFKAAFVAAFLVSLAGCKEGVVDARVAAVQKATSALCKFVPTAATIGTILAGGNPVVATAAGAAGAICAAVASAPTKQNFMGFGKDCKGFVGDVCVEGEFVK